MLPILILSLIYSILLDTTNYQNMISHSQTNLQYMMSNIEKQIELADKVALWFSSNKHLDKLLVSLYTQKSQESVEILTFNKYAQEYLINHQVGNHISKIFIQGNNGVEFQLGDHLSVINRDTLIEEEWFRSYKEASFDELVQSPDLYAQRKVFPVSRAIVDSINGKTIGWNIVFYRDTLLSSVFQAFKLKEGEQIFMINTKGECIAHSQSRYIGQDLSVKDYIQKILQEVEEEGYFETEIQGVRYLMTYYTKPDKGLILVQTSSLQSYYQRKAFLFKMTVTIMILTGLACLLSGAYLSETLTKPIKKILLQVQKISKGDFKINREIEVGQELGIIGKEINQMAKSMDGLVKELIREEREKKNLELRMLQNQINPHFLYNTLNCIVWMATIQKAEGIKEMTKALVRLLQNISKGCDYKITLAEEFALVEDYVFIQNIRYNGKIDLQYEIEDEDLKQAGIIKFTLQPIIENAIFHGIEPKKGQGLIKIRLMKVQDTIQIDILDNGIGMDFKKAKGSKLSGMGIQNVEQRIKLYYGKGYGISIQSKKEEYTKVTLIVPYEKLE
jgi:two-component system sensor histidine kinase YesM